MEKKMIKKEDEKREQAGFDFVSYSGEGFIKHEPSLEVLYKHFSVKYDKSLRKLAL